MPMNLPTLADLQDLYGAGSVTALDQAEQQQGLARQWAQGELSGQEQDVQAKTLKNVFDTQQNPQLLEQRRLQNIGLGNDNVISGVTSRRAAANEGMQLSEDQRKFALTATEQDLKQAELWAQGEMQSGDPQRMADAKRITDFTTAAIAARQKHAYDLALEAERTRSHLSGIGMQTRTQKQINDDNIAAGKFAKNANNGIGVSLVTQIQKMKVPERLGTLNGILQTGVNPATQEPLTEIERMFFQNMYDQDARTTDARTAAQGQGVVLGAQPGGGVGLVPKVAPSVRGSGTPAQADHTLSDLRAAYPGKTEAELKAAYKRKFGVDPR